MQNIIIIIMIIFNICIKYQVPRVLKHLSTSNFRVSIPVRLSRAITQNQAEKMYSYYNLKLGLILKKASLHIELICTIC